MPDPGQLSVNERVLLHLSRLATDTSPQEHPAEASQAGIASSVGISRTHVPRAVKSLIREGLVEELRARVAGHERRMSVYAITSGGVRRASELWGRLSDTSFTLKTAGRAEEVTGRDIEERVGRKRALALVARSRDGVVEMEPARRSTVRNLASAPTPASPFLGRKEELESMSAFLDSESDLLVILGNRGYGASALTRHFVDGLDHYNILWVSLPSLEGLDALKALMLGFAERYSPGASDPFDALGIADTVMVFDGYHRVPEEMVEFFSNVIDRTEEAKVILTAREDTPAYNWFYHKREVESGKVRELRIKGLDKESAKALLGNPGIEPDAFRRIYVMTRGSPTALTMLREGDFEGLKKATVLTSEEIRYLLFLKDKTA